MLGEIADLGGTDSGVCTSHNAAQGAGMGMCRAETIPIADQRLFTIQLCTARVANRNTVNHNCLDPAVIYLQLHTESVVTSEDKKSKRGLLTFSQDTDTFFADVMVLPQTVHTHPIIPSSHRLAKSVLLFTSVRNSQALVPPMTIFKQ